MILIIFDVDGTLVHSDRRDSQLFDRTYRELYGRPFPSLDWRDFPHVTDDTLFKTAIRQHFDREVEAHEIPHFQVRYLNYLKVSRQQEPTHFKQVAGASELVRRLMADKNYTVGIATGGWKAPAQVKLGHVEIPHEEMIVTGADGKLTREEILTETMELSHFGSRFFEKTVYVGDAIWDVSTTRNLNLPFVGIRHRADVEVLYEAGAQTVIEDYQDYEFFLESIAKAVPPAGVADQKMPPMKTEN